MLQIHNTLSAGTTMCISSSSCTVPQAKMSSSVLALTPAGLLDGRLDDLPAGTWATERRFLIETLRDRRCGAGYQQQKAHDIWRTLIPDRPNMARMGSITDTQPNSYDWIIGSLTSWFRCAPLNKAAFLEWSMSAIIDVLRSDDIGARAAQFRLASQTVKGLVSNLEAKDLSLLSHCLKAE